MKTLSQRIAEAAQRGFTKKFRVVGDRLIGVNHTYFTPRQVTIFDYFRLSGCSDPKDSSILYLIETNDGQKGTLIDAYRVYADSMISDFVHEIDSAEFVTRN